MGEALSGVCLYYVGDVVQMKSRIPVAVMNGKLSGLVQTFLSYVKVVVINY